MMDYSSAVYNRLRRIEGQVRGVLAMMENQRQCADVVTQLSAIRRALDKTMATVVAENLEACFHHQTGNQMSDSAIREAIELLIKSR